MIDGYYSVDYQVHSLCSHDGKASLMAMCERAVEVGLDEIGFSEHKDFDPADPLVNYFDYDAYMREVAAARLHFGDSLKILAGIEIDYQIWFEDKIGSYLEVHDFDFVLGSVHYVNRVKVMSEEYNRTRTAELAYADYFHAVRDSVNSGLFDVLAHLEYANRIGIKAWGEYNVQAHVNELSPVFDDAVRHNMVLEINTAGIEQGIGATYPCAAAVALYAARGGRRLNIGSDSHSPDKLGRNYATAVETAFAAGISHVTTWSKRQPRQVALSPQGECTA